MKSMFEKIKKLLRRRSVSDQSASTLDVLRGQLPDATMEQLQIINSVQTHTMTSPERILALCNAVDYVVENGVQGSIVECGVWRGGSMAAAAKTLIAQDSIDRDLWLYDTFDGMTAPTQDDVDCWGYDADQLLAEQKREDASSVWCVSALEEVKTFLKDTTYPEQQIRYIPGRVEDTLPDHHPEKIALLRLDTDWYESTKCELEVLFPRLQPGGVLIIDDYGHWQGCRKAVDEYIADHQIKIFLNRIDYTGRLGIKLPVAVTDVQTGLNSISNVA